MDLQASPALLRRRAWIIVVAVVAALAEVIIGALDAAMGLLERCARRVGAVRGRVRFTRASAGSLPYNDNSFDIVLASRFLHLFPVE
jgi:ubiquinone/menaquinone biosynthesis C-methylase UbiE